jgi:hypothetical protein
MKKVFSVTPGLAYMIQLANSQPAHLKPFHSAKVYALVQKCATFCISGPKDVRRLTEISKPEGHSIPQQSKWKDCCLYLGSAVVGLASIARDANNRGDVDNAPLLLLAHHLCGCLQQCHNFSMPHVETRRMHMCHTLSPVFNKENPCHC